MVVVVGLREMLVGYVADDGGSDGKSVTGCSWTGEIGVCGSEVGDGTSFGKGGR